MASKRKVATGRPTWITRLAENITKAVDKHRRDHLVGSRDSKMASELTGSASCSRETTEICLCLARGLAYPQTTLDPGRSLPKLHSKYAPEQSQLMPERYPRDPRRPPKSCPDLSLNNHKWTADDIRMTRKRFTLLHVCTTITAHAC